LSPEMLFRAGNRWWGDRGPRPASHEGIDICLLKDDKGCLCRLNNKTNIPAIFDGKIVKIDDDFLGKSVFMAHKIYNNEKKQLYTIYGHTTLHNNIHNGAILNEGEIFAVISNPPASKRAISPHLHLSMAWISVSLPGDKLNWELVNGCSEIALIDPLKLIDFSYVILPHYPAISPTEYEIQSC